MHRTLYGVALASALFALTACSESSSPVAIDPGTEGLAAAGKASEATGPTRVAALVESVNARLEAADSELRLDEAWMFSIGRGTDPFRRLRTGRRWVDDAAPVTYIVDLSDLTPDAPAAAVESALVNAFETWNEIGNVTARFQREPDPGLNIDVLDAEVLDDEGVCVDVFDVTAANVIDVLPSGDAIFFPVEDVIFGGWLPPSYFENCLGSASILGVTWSFSSPDQNGDGYRDLQYVEEYYNENFVWVTEGSIFLGPPGEDIETIVLHENGHALGLGHFGGPNARQPFKLRGNNTKVFTPEAVMNPFYLGGEKRTPLPTDIAGLRTLYAQKGR